MKYFQPRLLLYSLPVVFIILITGCSKETETARSQKEIVTSILINDVKADSLEKFITWMQEMGTRFALDENHRDIAVSIKNKFIQLGYPDTKLDSFWITKIYNSTTYEQWQYNVIATLEGSSNPDSICILGGHYDNTLKAISGDPFITAYGANDNASGVAAALEIARVMKKNNYSPRNTIRFIAFGAEELGLKGSIYQSNNSFINNDKIKIMLNNDMIAYQPLSDKANWTVDIMDYDNSQDVRNNAQILTDKYTILNSVNINTYNKQSDSYPYFLNGYKALFFFAYSNDPNYHTLNDIASSCNFEFCREIVNISCAMLVDMN